MAEFCEQCNQEIFKKSSDYKGRVKAGQVLMAICEGCGATVMNEYGVCVADCLKHHSPRYIKLPDGNWLRVMTSELRVALVNTLGDIPEEVTKALTGMAMDNRNELIELDVRIRELENE